MLSAQQGRAELSG